MRTCARRRQILVQHDSRSAHRPSAAAKTAGVTELDNNSKVVSSVSNDEARRYHDNTAEKFLADLKVTPDYSLVFSDKAKEVTSEECIYILLDVRTD